MRVKAEVPEAVGLSTPDSASVAEPSGAAQRDGSTENDGRGSVAGSGTKSQPSKDKVSKQDAQETNKPISSNFIGKLNNLVAKDSTAPTGVHTWLRARMYTRVHSATMIINVMASFLHSTSDWYKYLHSAHSFGMEVSTL